MTCGVLSFSILQYAGLLNLLHLLGNSHILSISRALLYRLLNLHVHVEEKVSFKALCHQLLSIQTTEIAKFQ